MGPLSPIRDLIQNHPSLLPYPTLPCPTLPYPALPYPALPCPALPCPACSANMCPALPHLHHASLPCSVLIPLCRPHYCHATAAICYCHATALTCYCHATALACYCHTTALTCIRPALPCRSWPCTSRSVMAAAGCSTRLAAVGSWRCCSCWWGSWATRWTCR